MSKFFTQLNAEFLLTNQPLTIPDDIVVMGQKFEKFGRLPHFLFKLTHPLDQKEVRFVLRSQFREQIDLAWIARDFKPSAFFLDMDATVIQEESLVEFAKICGQGDRVHKITELAMEGKLDFASALKERVALLKDTPADKLKSFSQNLHLSHGFASFAKKCLKLKIPMFICSGGFRDMAEPIASKFFVKQFVANEFEIVGNKLSGQVKGRIIDAQAKAEFLKTCCAKYSIDRARVVAVGDGANDRFMMEEAGYACGFGAKEVLYKYLDALAGRRNFDFLEAIFIEAKPVTGG